MKWSSPNVVSITTPVAGMARWMRAAAVIPSRPGI